MWLAVRKNGPDHAELPVTLPRQSDSDMRRDGRHAAREQHQPAVDERGRVRGVPDLFCFALLRTLASNRARLHAMEEKRRWRRLAETRPQIRARDKSAASRASRSGWFCWLCAYGHGLVRPYAFPNCGLLALKIRMATFFCPIFCHVQGHVPVFAAVSDSSTSSSGRSRSGRRQFQPIAKRHDQLTCGSPAAQRDRVRVSG